MDLRVEVEVTTCQGVGLGNGVGVDCWAALVCACMGFKVGVVGRSVTSGVILGAGASRLQLVRIITNPIQQKRDKRRILLI